MNHAANAYSRVSQAAMPPREVEAAVLIKAATRLQAIGDDWEARRAELDGALTYNRRLWTILVSSVTEDANPLPAGVKQNIVNLGVFIFNHMVSIAASPEVAKLAVLVNINRQVAAGLRAPVRAAA